MPEKTASATDLFEIIRTTRSMRRVKPDPVPNELIRKILEAVCVRRVVETCSGGGSALLGTPKSSGRWVPTTSAHGTSRSRRDIVLVNPRLA
jgi:hypothetical protein